MSRRWKRSARRFGTGGAPTANAPEAQPAFRDVRWKRVGIGSVPDFRGDAGWGWYRTALNVSPADISQGRTTLYFDGVEEHAVIYVNGERVIEHRGADEPFSVIVNDRLRAGPNVIAVAAKNANGPGAITKPVTLNSAEAGALINGWEICTGLEGERAGWQKADAPGPPWMKAILPENRTQRTNTDRWYRTSFRLPADAGSHAVWRLKVDASGEGVVYLNGALLGPLSDRDRPAELDLPDRLLFTGSRPNIIALALHDADLPASLRTIEVTHSAIER